MPDPDRSVELLIREASRRFLVSANRVRVVRAPYRICPLGAHIDHQGGTVTAMAIDRGVLLAYLPTASRQVAISSLDFPGQVHFHLDEVPDKRNGEWGNYARGAARALQQRYSLSRGLQGLTSGRLDGGGLSSSAAVGVAYLMALEDANGLAVSPRENIALHSSIENGYLGLKIGILDQAAILLSAANHLTRIDCATVQHQLFAYPTESPSFKIMLAFSGLKKALVGTDYNRRVAECRQAAGLLLAGAGRADRPHLLGNVRPAEYDAYRGQLEPVAARRAAHFFSELERVERGVAAWQRGDLTTFGRLMTESGASSITNYQCGCPPLVALYELLVSSPGVHGARFSGAGFRGCCVAFVEPDRADTLAHSVLSVYRKMHPELADNARVILCNSADCAEIVSRGTHSIPPT